MLASGDANRGVFFNFLRLLGEALIRSKSNVTDKWAIYVPAAQITEIRGFVPPSSKVFNYEEQFLSMPIDEYDQYFKSFEVGSSSRWSFIGRFPFFWMGLGDDVRVYAEYNSEIIVVGIDLSKEEIGNENIRAIIGEFGYTSFTDYANEYPSNITGLSENNKILLQSIFKN